MRTRFRMRLGRRVDEPYPAVGGNSLAIGVRGPGFFEGMLAAIRAARTDVDVEMYLWDDDEVGRSFVDALRDAAARGLRVRVLVDAAGAASVVDLLDAVDAAGGDVRLYNPFRFRFRFLRRYFHRTHKKLLVCDGERAFTGGAGFSKHWSSGARREDPWHDRMFELRGPIVRQIVHVFETDFHRWRARRTHPERVLADPTLDLTPAGAVELRALRSWPDAMEFRTTLLDRVRAAKERIWLGSPYFIPPPSLLRALTAALRRGVDVRLVLPSGNFAHPLLWLASRRHYGWFVRRGARVHEYAEGFYHAKLAVFDSAAAIVGSSNLDYWSWNRNAESDLVVTDAPTVELIANSFLADVSKSREVTLAEIRGWSIWSRMQENAVGWVERWL